MNNSIWNKAHTIRVVDTNFSKGRLAQVHEVHLEDLAKFHGHLCDGLVVGHLGLKAGLTKLYGTEDIDRTNTRVVCKSSPCLTDAAVYLTGGRYQFDTFYVSNDLDALFIVQRIDDQRAVSVRMREGVKPEVIDQLGARAVQGTLGACGLDSLRELEDHFSKQLMHSQSEDIFIIEELENFKWNPILRSDFLKTDVLNKDKPKCNN